MAASAPTPLCAAAVFDLETLSRPSQSSKDFPDSLEPALDSDFRAQPCRGVEVVGNHVLSGHASTLVPTDGAPEISPLSKKPKVYMHSRSSSAASMDSDYEDALAEPAAGSDAPSSSATVPPLHVPCWLDTMRTLDLKEKAIFTTVKLTPLAQVLHDAMQPTDCPHSGVGPPPAPPPQSFKSLRSLPLSIEPRPSSQADSRTTQRCRRDVLYLVDD